MITERDVKPEGFGKNGLCVLFGDSLMEIAEYLERTPRRWKQTASVTANASRDWDYFVGYKGAWEMAMHGWKEGAAKLADSLRALPPPVTAHAKRRYDVAGYEPNVGRYMGGMPDCMLTQGRPMGAQPVTHVVVNGAIMADITSRECENFGLAVASCIDKLESAGRRIELDIVFCSMGKEGMDYLTGWKIKRAGEALDISNIAFAIGHPAAFRRIGFATRERTSSESKGYGWSRSLERRELTWIGAPDDAFIINGIAASSGKCATKEGAIKYAAAQINAAAGEVIVELV